MLFNTDKYFFVIFGSCKCQQQFSQGYGGFISPDIFHLF